MVGVAIRWRSLYAGGQCTLAVAICRRLLYAGGHLGSRCSLAEAREREFIKVDLVGSPIYTESVPMCWLPTHTTSLPFALPWHLHRLYTVRWGCVVVCCRLLYSDSHVAVYCTLASCMLAYTAGRVIVCCQLLYSGSRVAVHLTQARLYAVRWSMLLAYTAGRVIVCCQFW